MSNSVTSPIGTYSFDTDCFERSRPDRATPQLVPRKPDECGLEPARRNEHGGLEVRGAVGVEAAPPDTAPDGSQEAVLQAALRLLGWMRDGGALACLREIERGIRSAENAKCIHIVRPVRDGIKFIVIAGPDYDGENPDGDSDEFWMLGRAAWEWGRLASS